MVRSSYRLLHSEKNTIMLSVVNLFTSSCNPPIVGASSSTKKVKLNSSYFLLALHGARAWWLLNHEVGNGFPVLRA